MEVVLQNKKLDLISSEVNGKNVAEIRSDTLLIEEAGTAVELLVDLSYQGFDVILVHAENIAPGFFDLSSGIAGEILQKVSTYSIRLMVIGDMSSYPSTSLQDFIRESNKLTQVNFVPTVEDAHARLGGKR